MKKQLFVALSLLCFAAGNMIANCQGGKCNRRPKVAKKATPAQKCKGGKCSRRR